MPTQSRDAPVLGISVDPSLEEQHIPHLGVSGRREDLSTTPSGMSGTWWPGLWLPKARGQRFQWTISGPSHHLQGSGNQKTALLLWLVREPRLPHTPRLRAKCASLIGDQLTHRLSSKTKEPWRLLHFSLKNLSRPPWIPLYSLS